MNVPCKGCGLRCLGCHGKCSMYKEYREHAESKRKDRFRENAERYDLIYELKAMRKEVKRREFHK